MHPVGPSGEFGSGPLLVTGIPERSRASSCWRESMTGIIRRSWASRQRSPRTRQAEAGLGITGAPHYFYAMRTERAFGVAVFFFRETQSSEWREDLDGATPFDSGGLWHGKVRTSPPARPPANPGDLPDPPGTIGILDAGIRRIHRRELSLHGGIHRRSSPKYRNSSHRPRPSEFITRLDVGGADTQRLDVCRCRAAPWILVGRRSTNISDLALGRQQPG